MSQITYVPSGGASPRGQVNAGGGITFDVGAALTSGGGQFTVDSVANPLLVYVLDHYPGLVRSGNTPGTTVIADNIGPVIAHSGTNPSINDILVRGPDGLFFPEPASQLPGSGGSTASFNWTPNTLYAAGALAVQSGIVYQNQTGSSFTSASTWAADASNWTALTAAGNELAYAEILANVTGIGSGGTDIPGLAITFVAPARPVLLEFFAADVGGQTGAGNWWNYIRDSANTIWGQAFSGNLAAGVTGPSFTVKRRIATGVLTAGTSYTFKATCSAAGGAGILGAGTAFPAFLRAVQN